MVENRDRENLKIAETNVANTALREAAITEWKNEFWLAFEVALHDVAPIRLEALRVTYRMSTPSPNTWVDGVSAFRAVEAALVTNAIARPGEAISHDDVHVFVSPACHITHHRHLHPVHDAPFSTLTIPALPTTPSHLTLPYRTPPHHSGRRPTRV
jgi:hypothetical protein